MIKLDTRETLKTFAVFWWKTKSTDEMTQKITQLRRDASVMKEHLHYVELGIRSATDPDSANELMDLLSCYCNTSDKIEVLGTLFLKRKGKG